MDGKTERQISKESGYSKSNVVYWISKYELNDLSKHKKVKYKDENMFNKIDTPEKAYILGFTLADSYISEKNIEYVVALNDCEILDFISKQIGGKVNKSYVLDKKNKRFPRARYSVSNKNILIDINKHGSKKTDRHIPIVKKELKRYLLLGFFDGDGCITWGRRKDRNRIWHKISFTSSYNLLLGIQKILIDEVGISSSLRPKSDAKCFVLEFSNKKDVIKFLDYTYKDDFLVLKRKYDKAEALRLELGELREVPITLSEAV